MPYLYKTFIDKTIDPPTFTVRIYDTSQNFLGIESSVVYEPGMGASGVLSSASEMAQSLVDSIAEQPDPVSEHQVIVSEIEGFETTLDTFFEISPTEGGGTVGGDDTHG